MKIMYFIHIKWNWIKQRPQFIAEYLSKNNQLEVYEFESFNQKNKIVLNKSKIKINKIFSLPLLRFNIMERINEYFTYFQIAKDIKKYDIFYIPTPSIGSILRKSLRILKKDIVYDCMDDYYTMTPDGKRKKYLRDEKLLLREAKIIVFSSEYLKDKVLSRCKVEDESKIIVLNNGIDQRLIENYKNISKKEKEGISEIKKIIYIGTIGKWFDIEFLLESLKYSKKIEYHLYGPLEITLPKHSRIKYNGVLNHFELNDVMEQSDALIMPFIVNDIVLAVNPVKVYEYISSKKPILLIRYGETEKFKDYAYLYNNLDDFLKLINQLVEDKLEFKGKHRNIKEYLSKNTWESRVKELLQKLESDDKEEQL